MIKKILSVFSKVWEYVTNYIEQYNEQQEKEKKATQLSQINNNIYSLMLDMRMDLFESFKEKSYPCVNTITSVSQIRIDNYRLFDNEYEYKFRLAKKNTDTIPFVLVSDIRDNMNRDIKATTATLLYSYDSSYLKLMFPYLARNLHVVGIYDTGGADIIIVVSFMNLIPSF